MLTLRSPAKINLFLRILNKRPDGYHNLASLFQALDLCDELTFSFSEKDCLTCNHVKIPTDASNLILKAADLFRKKTGLQFGLSINLNKIIPIEAGLGGGSSNAATTLWALNQLCKTSISDDTLQKWSSEIGSDIPFFFSLGSAYCTGRGEIVEPTSALPYHQVWIVKPKEGLSTKEVYGHMKTAELVQRDPLEHLKHSHLTYYHLFNDMEESAFHLCPSLNALKQQLQDAGFDKVLMSGSGTSFFCLGNGHPPQIQDAFIAKASFLHRTPSSWY